jgi:hypothetical protein
MIATLNSDCSSLTLYSEALVAASGKTFVSLTLKSRLNCSLTETSVTVTSLIGSITNKTITIPSTTFYNDATKTTYCDGVYYFELEIVYDISSGGVTRYQVDDGACKLIDCALKCAVLEYYLECKDRKAYYQYYALQQGNDCDSCYCTEMCSLYTELKNLLNDSNISVNSSGCGCS